MSFKTFPGIIARYGSLFSRVFKDHRSSNKSQKTPKCSQQGQQQSSSPLTRSPTMTPNPLPKIIPNNRIIKAVAELVGKYKHEDKQSKSSKQAHQTENKANNASSTLQPLKVELPYCPTIRLAGASRRVSEESTLVNFGRPALVLYEDPEYSPASPIEDSDNEPNWTPFPSDSPIGSPADSREPLTSFKRDYTSFHYMSVFSPPELPPSLSSSSSPKSSRSSSPQSSTTPQSSRCSDSPRGIDSGRTRDTIPFVLNSNLTTFEEEEEDLYDEDGFLISPRPPKLDLADIQTDLVVPLMTCHLGAIRQYEHNQSPCANTDCEWKHFVSHDSVNATVRWKLLHSNCTPLPYHAITTLRSQEEYSTTPQSPSESPCSANFKQTFRGSPIPSRYMDSPRLYNIRWTDWNDRKIQSIIDSEHSQMNTHARKRATQGQKLGMPIRSTRPTPFFRGIR